MSTTQTRPTLSRAQAIAWATAEVALIQARAAAEAAKAKCEEMLWRYEERLEPSDDPDDAGKNVKIGRAGGWQIRVSRFTGGPSFSLSDYLKAGGKITKAMEPHVKPGTPRARVTVKRLAGPTKPGAVEPAG